MSAPPPVVLEVLRGSTSPARPEGGGRTVYVVTKEDVYETMFGDGEYQHFSSAYWNKDEADADVADRNEAEQRTAETEQRTAEAEQRTAEAEQPALISPPLELNRLNSYFLRPPSRTPDISSRTQKQAPEPRNKNKLQSPSNTTPIANPRPPLFLPLCVLPNHTKSFN